LHLLLHSGIRGFNIFFPLLLGFDIESERKRKEEQYFLFLGLHFCGNKESMELDL